MRVYNGDSRRNVSDRFRAAIRETRTAKTFLGIWGRGESIDETDNFFRGNATSILSVGGLFFLRANGEFIMTLGVTFPFSRSM